MKQEPQPPGTAARPQPTAGGRPVVPRILRRPRRNTSLGRRCSRKTSRERRPAETGPALPTRRHQATEPASPSQTTSAEAEPPQTTQAKQMPADDPGEADASADYPATTAITDRQPSCERFRPGAAGYSISAESRDSPCSAGPWCGARMGSTAASSTCNHVGARLGFGRKADQPEPNPTAQPGQQQAARSPRSRRQPHLVGRPRRVLRQVQCLRGDRRLVRRSSSARRLETSPAIQPARGPRWPLV